MDAADFETRIYFPRLLELISAESMEAVVEYAVTFDELPDEFIGGEGAEELEVCRVYEHISSVFLRSSVAAAVRLLETYPDAKLYEPTPMHSTEEG